VLAAAQDTEMIQRRKVVARNKSTKLRFDTCVGARKITNIYIRNDSHKKIFIPLISQ
jgi:hypothetical protein